MFIDRQVAEVASGPSIVEVLRMRRAKREAQEKATADGRMLLNDGPTLLTGRAIDEALSGESSSEEQSAA